MRCAVSVSSRGPAWLSRELGHCFLKVQPPSGGLAAGLVPLGNGGLIWFIPFDSLRFVPSPEEGLETFVGELLRPFPGLVRHTRAATGPDGPPCGTRST